MTDTNIVVEATDRSRSKPSCRVLISDFANMVKAFIGSNYLTVAYAFTQSGLVMGIICLLAIAAVTDHCCHLLVKCKYHAIRKVLGRTGYRSNSSVNKEGGMLVGSESDDDEDDEKEESGEIYKQMMRSLTYGDIGKIAMGPAGLFIVNACLLFTQFGFCVGYFIFVGNTIYSLFPFRNTTLAFNETVNQSVFAMPATVESTSVNSGVQDINISLQDTFEYLASTVSNISQDTSTTPSFISTSVPLYNISHYISISESPDLRLLVIAPLPIFIGFAFMRNVRHLGFVSVGADISIFLGCIVTFVYIIAEFEVSDTWSLYEWSTLPVFFGMITSSYEGIGTIIPIESSMEGNRHNFENFLHGAVFILTCMLTVFGVVGYLEYGNGTEQMLNKNIPATTGVGMAINLFLCIGVILTFPLQIYPVIELTEIYTFGHGRVCGPKKGDDSDDEYDERKSGDSEALLPKREVEMPAPVAMTVPDEVSAWKRNLLRIFVVLLAAGVAVLMRNFFAYVSAFVGAIGSSLLAYVLPCMFHLKLCGRQLGYGIRIKDVIIILFGLVASLVSVYTTIKEMVEKSS